MAEPEGPVRVKDVLAAATRKLGIDSPVEAGRVWARWVDIVGESMAAHAEPTSLRKKILRVRADSPVWATEIGYLGDSIKARANELLGGEVVAEVKVWWAPTPLLRRRRPGSATASGTGSTTPPETAGADASDGALGTTTDDPQQAFERARRAWERRRRRGRSQPGSEGSERRESPW